MTSPPRLGAVVLAAGAGSRFGGGKLLAPLDGRPILAHVLDAVRTVGPAETVVVLGHGRRRRSRRRVAWAGERRVVNPEPEIGACRARSRSGFEALDGPHGRDDLDARLRRAGRPAARRSGGLPRARPRPRSAPGSAFVAPRYVGGGGANPVLVLRAGRPWIAEASGDRGLGPILAAHPELVAEVELGGTNPDVDTPADLAELAWADRVRRDRDQVDRLPRGPRRRRLLPPGDGPLPGRPAADRRAGPRRAAGARAARPTPGSTSAPGAGRYALPLALRVREVVADRAVRPAMRSGARRAHGRARHRQRPRRRRPLAARGRLAGARRSAPTWRSSPTSATTSRRSGRSSTRWRRPPRRLCVAVLMERQPSSVADPFWPPIHGEPRVRLPALHEFIELLRARGRSPKVSLFDRPGARVRLARRAPWLRPAPALAGARRRRRTAGSPSSSGRRPRRSATGPVVARASGPAVDRGRDLAPGHRGERPGSILRQPDDNLVVDASTTRAYPRPARPRA